MLGALFRCAPEEFAYGPSGGDVDGGAGADGSGTGGSTFDAAGWIEVCGNGVDDDDNGLTDCEDPVCNEYACVPAAPTGWAGPMAVFAATPTMLPECPEGLDKISDHLRDPRFDRAQCESCGCGSPSNQGCAASVKLSTSGSCSSTNATVQVSGGGCVKGGLSGAVTAADVSINGTGSCSVTKKTSATTTPSTWATAFRACEAPNPGVGVGCDSGSVCAPAAAGAEPCILQAGEHACPAEFPSRRLVFDNLSDTRGCSSCQCGYSGSCTATVTGFPDESCLAPQSFQNKGGCATGLTDVKGLQLSGAAGPTGGKCTASGGSPTGCVLPETPTTMCCAGTGAKCPSGKGPEMIEVPKVGGGTYCIDSTEVTNSQYDAFLKTSPAVPNIPECAFKTDLTPGTSWPDPDLDEAVNFLDWCDAYAFCAWAGKRLCGDVGGGASPFASANTPDSQWHNACSAGGTQDFPYGTDTVSGACSTSLSDTREFPCCQGGYSGIYDMTGYLREWVDACSGTAGKGDDCRVMGKTNCQSGDAVKRNRRAGNIGFRCCAP